MGILKLMDFLRSKFPGCIANNPPTNYAGRILAVDASNTMYQFLVKTQSTNYCLLSDYSEHHQHTYRLAWQ